MTNAQRILEFAERVHDELWAAWFPQDAGLTKASLFVHEITLTSPGETGYHQDLDTIEVAYYDGDAEEALRDADGTLNKSIDHGWSGIRQDVIHETLHEYQRKVLEEATAAGRALYAQRQKTFAGPGHDAVWYSAIAQFAPHFNLTAPEFEMRL